MNKLLTFPDSFGMALSIRAKALLFHDPRSSALLEQVERVARSDATVLVIGETGTGKELIARHIHAQSDRKGPFIAVNCGAFSESLIDAELFGHETGAFTGASQKGKRGLIEEASGGTLFLDEIGDMPLSLQSRLLRVLSENEVQPVGALKARAVRLRVLSASHRDLAELVKEGRFRQDLYYRLNAATVTLPALRERQDLGWLIGHLLGRIEREDGQPYRLDKAARAALLAHAWPGNLRELRNMTGAALEHEDEQEAAAAALVAKGSCEVLVLSLGSGGALLLTKDGTRRYRSPTVPLKSTVGAGDSMVAGIVMRLHTGAPLVDAVAYGVACGAAAVATPGTGFGSKDFVERLYERVRQGS